MSRWTMRDVQHQRIGDEKYSLACGGASVGVDNTVLSNRRCTSLLYDSGLGDGLCGRASWFECKRGLDRASLLSRVEDLTSP